jgi:outer membrane biosynthesis protein TonB
VIKVQGSHAILDITVESSSGDPVLDACSRDTVKGAKIAREVGDTESHIGFMLTTVYSRS